MPETLGRLLMCQWPEVGCWATPEPTTITGEDNRGAGNIGNKIVADSREESASGF